ncbi:hypothetical protein Hanom_Chr01g00075941 [Helianthus anomalus]
MTQKVTSISQERALVGAGMSMLWAPQNPKGIQVYGYQGKVGYSLLNVLDPKAAGAIVEAILPGGKPVWLDQIRDRFLHPTSDSFAAYANAILGEDAPPQGTVPEPVNEPAADDDVETAVDTTEQLETRKKKKREDKSEEKKAKEIAVKAPRKRPSTSPFLSYVVVSDTLSGLDTGDKHTKSDPDDDATLTEIVKRKKALEDKKK